MVDRISDSQSSPTRDVAEVTSRSTPQELLQDPRVRAMLDTVAHAEGTGDRYNITFGYREFSDMSRHPNIRVTEGGYTSTAAGRYQFLNGTWNGVADRLNLPDFSPHSQDLAAVQLMKDRGMIAPLLAGDIEGAIRAGAPEWASLPTANGDSYYGQPVRTMESLRDVYDGAVRAHGDGTAPVAPPVQQPPATEGPSPEAAEPVPQPAAPDAGYTVARGDTLWGIARDNGMSVGQLLSLPGNERFNANPDLIYRGDVVNLGAAAAGDYTVKRGDTLTGIAQDHGVSLQALIAANPRFGDGGSRNPDLIRPQETLRVPGAAAGEATASPAPSGETPVEQAPPAAPVPGVAAGQTWAPFVVRSGGREISDPGQVNTHHSDAGGRVHEGQTLIPRDVVIQAPGLSRNDAPIPSPVSGTVVDAGSGIAQDTNGYGGRGNYVVLKSDQGEYVKIYHMTDVAVSNGQRVDYGQSLGTQGNTGRSQGTHVHIEAAPQVFGRWVGDLLDGRFDGRRNAG